LLLPRMKGLFLAALFVNRRSQNEAQ